VANDVTAAKLGALVTNATPTSGLIQDRTAETVVAVNDTLLIGDASDSNNLKRMTVANLLKAPLVSTSGTIDVLTTGTTTSTAQIVTSGTIATLNSTTGTIATLNSTTGTIATLNSTTGTITNLSATTSTFLGTITGSTNVVNIGSGQIYKDASGNVGIGVVSPTAKLEVGTAGSSGSVLRVVPDGANGVLIKSDRSDTSGARYLAFGTDYNERLRIDLSGNVGIGTTSPSARLHVLTTSDGAQLILNGPQTVNEQTLLFRTNYHTNNSSAGFSAIGSIDQGSQGGILTLKTTAISSGASGTPTERLRIDASGNVGINTTAPSSRLEVIHTGGQGINCVNNGGAGTVNYSIMGQSAGSASVNTGIYANVYNASSNYGVRILNPPAGASNWAIYSDAGAQSYFAGNVGIGATTPANKLEIVGSFGRGAPVTKTGDFTLADTENWIIVNKGSTGTATLPVASSWTGREFTIKVITAHTVVSASSNVVPRNSATPGTAILAAAAGNWATLVSNGTNWVIMCGS
jgi:hypothetical protein